MKIIKLDINNFFSSDLEEAIEVLNAGGVIIYPTDTLYGLGVNAFNEEAVDLVFNIKKRSYNKAISVCVSDYDYISKIAYVSDDIKETLKKNLPGPFTFLLNKKSIISDKLSGGTDKIGIRIPDNPICSILSKNFPITASSANFSGKITENSIEKILKQLNYDVDLAIDIGYLNNGQSTVVDLSSNETKIVRKGIANFIK